VAGNPFQPPDPRLLDGHLRRAEYQLDAVDALELELDDFVDSIRAGRQPRVTGQQAREAVALAERVLGALESHAWEGDPNGPVGPLAVPPPEVIPTPAWHPAARRRSIPPAA